MTNSEPTPAIPATRFRMVNDRDGERTVTERVDMGAILDRLPQLMHSGGVRGTVTVVQEHKENEPATIMARLSMVPQAGPTKVRIEWQDGDSVENTIERGTRMALACGIHDGKAYLESGEPRRTMSITEVGTT